MQKLFLNDNSLSIVIYEAIQYIRLCALKNDLPFEATFSQRAEFDALIKAKLPFFERDALLRRLVTAKLCEHKINEFLFTGYCDICEKYVDFLLDGVWDTHTEGLRCPHCMSNSRLRNIYKTIKDEYENGMAVYISEQVTPFFENLKKLIPDIIGSEFLPHESKTLLGEVRHEDVQNLTFDSQSLDMYISNDVFEHVFDFQKAFNEAYRVLKPKGFFIFHIPFHYGNDITTVRATYENGLVTFLLDPVYHGDPLSDTGVLCVQDFGWDIFDYLKQAGFAAPYALRNDMDRGFLNETAIVFLARK